MGRLRHAIARWFGEAPRAGGRAVRSRVRGGALALACLPGVGWAEPVIFAAASTRAALDHALVACDMPATVSYGASGTIARQIAAGAPADVFLSANPKWMEYLAEQGLLTPDAADVLVSNRLVLIAPDGAAPVDLEPARLAARLDGGFFAVADPTIAPVGQYGKEALMSLELWSTIETALLPTRNTISTVATVQRGEAALGLVYRSDATGVEGITIAAEIPPEAHAPIHYLIATMGQGGDSAAAADLLPCLTGQTGQAAFAEKGFVPVEEGA